MPLRPNQHRELVRRSRGSHWLESKLLSSQRAGGHRDDFGIAGAIVTNTLFMLGASFLLGGIKHHTQEYNRVSARLQAGLLFLATIALLVPSAIAEADSTTGAAFTNKLSVGLAVLLIAAYGLGMFFSLKTHREFFGSVTRGEEGEEPWPIGLALGTLAGATLLVALVSEIFVESVQEAAVAFGMTPAFVGFIVVALVGAAAEMASAFSGARKNRLDLSVGIALGSASQIALFVAPVLVGCSDSRVAPEIVFDEGLGDIFFIRTAGLSRYGNGHEK
jgi:Ca2+:H+ antiporter